MAYYPTAVKVRKFASDNKDKLFLKVQGTFNGMIDGFDDERDHDFELVKSVDNVGYEFYDRFKGEFVKETNDYLTINNRFELENKKDGCRYYDYDENGFIGYKVCTCTFNVVIAIKK